MNFTQLISILLLAAMIKASKLGVIILSAIAAKALQDIDVLVEKVSSVTGLSTQAISTQLEEANVQAFRLNDVILISPDDFDSIIDSWADSIKAKLSITTASTSSSSVAAKKTVKSVKAKSTKTATKTKTAAKAKVATKVKTATKAKATSTKSTGKALAWPKGFEENVSHLYTHTLKRVLPEAEAERKRYLEAIANETTAGKKLADELVTAIVTRSKRSLATEKVMAGLIAKCASMLA